MAKGPVHLLDVNVLVAILDQAHVHNELAEEWFDTPGLRWALCPFTEAGALRYFTRPKTGDLTMDQVTAMLDRLRQEPGYQYQVIKADWTDLTEPFAKRVHGHNQVTDAYLLGVSVRDGLVLTTFDRAILHMAGEHAQHVLVLEPK